MLEDFSLNRHHSLGTAATTIAATQLGVVVCAKTQSSNTDPAGATLGRCVALH